MENRINMNNTLENSTIKEIRDLKNKATEELNIFMKAFFEKYPFIDYIYLPRCGGVLKSSSDFKISIKSVEDL